MSSGPIGAPGSSKQRGQNHSPSGMASSGGIKHPRWYGESHYSTVGGMSNNASRDPGRGTNENTEPYHIPKENRHRRYPGHKRYIPEGYRGPPDVLADQNTCHSVERVKRSCSDPPRCWLHRKIPLETTVAITTRMGNRGTRNADVDGRQSWIMHKPNNKQGKRTS